MLCREPKPTCGKGATRTSHFTQPQGRLYVDALGDPSRVKPIQPVYAVCAVWLPHDADEENIFRRARQALGLREGYEFHASQLTKREKSAGMPCRFFELLRQYGLVARVQIVEVVKARTHLPPQYTGKLLTYKLIAQALMRFPQACVEGTALTIDETAHDKKPPTLARELRQYIKRTMEAAGLAYTVGTVHVRPAHQKAGLQLADFLAAAIIKPWPECAKELRKWDIGRWEV